MSKFETNVDVVTNAVLKKLTLEEVHEVSSNHFREVLKDLAEDESFTLKGVVLASAFGIAGVRAYHIPRGLRFEFNELSVEVGYITGEGYFFLSDAPFDSHVALYVVGIILDKLELEIKDESIIGLFLIALRQIYRPLNNDSPRIFAWGFNKYLELEGISQQIDFRGGTCFKYGYKKVFVSYSEEEDRFVIV